LKSFFVDGWGEAQGSQTLTERAPHTVQSDKELKPADAAVARERRTSAENGKIQIPLPAFVLLIVLATVLVFGAATLIAFTLANRTSPVASLPAETKSQPEVVPLIETATLQPTATRAATVTPRVIPTSTPEPILAVASNSSPTPVLPFISNSFTIGASAQGRSLEAYQVGHGPIKRALIGAIHGGYEWNTYALMTHTLEYLRTNQDFVPPEITLYIIPLANPDGYAAGTDRVNGRVNGNGVDLNRNWDYQWQITATHGTRPVSAGASAFSEPETIALRDFIMKNGIQSVIFYHSAFASVFQGAGITNSQTVELAKLIAQATGYRYAPEGVPGQITTGDAIDWLTMQGVTAIEVELTTHQDIDWKQNLNGLHAFLNWNLPVAETPQQANPTPLSSATGQKTYVVKPGDTLSQIAEQLNVPLAALIQANQISDPNSLLPGQELIIP
jgi:LysM repeat protein